MNRRRIDIGVIVAVAWLAIALWVTLLFGPRLGLRALIALGIHNVICLVACTHELRRGWRRRSAAVASAPAPAREE